MNNNRRQELSKAKNMIESAQLIIQNVKFDEEMAFDSLSEGLQQTMRGETMEENVEVLDEINDNINEILDKFNDIE